MISSSTTACVFEAFVDLDHITAVLQGSGIPSVSLIMQFSFDFGEFCDELFMNDQKLLIDPSYGVSRGIDCHLEAVDL